MLKLLKLLKSAGGEDAELGEGKVDWGLVVEGEAGGEEVEADEEGDDFGWVLGVEIDWNMCEGVAFGELGEGAGVGGEDEVTEGGVGAEVLRVVVFVVFGGVAGVVGVTFYGITVVLDEADGPFVEFAGDGDVEIGVEVGETEGVAGVEGA